MNPNAMAGTAPQRLMQDVMPPYMTAPATRTAVADTPSQASTPTVEPAVAPKPMFPVVTQPAPALAPAPAPTPVADSQPAPVAEAPTAPFSQPIVHQAQPMMTHKAKTNWLVIGLAVVVSSGLAVAAFVAFKPAG